MSCSHGSTVTLLAVLGSRGIATSLVIACTAIRPVFATFVAEFLIPALRPGQTVVLDNLSVHTGEWARAGR